MKRLLAFALVLGVLVSALAFACGDSVDHAYCTGIPDAGCPNPVSNCSDPTCAAIYQPDESCQWTFLQSCPGYVPPHDAGRDSPRAVAVDGLAFDGARRDVAVVLPPGASGGPGCEDLELPDCPVAEAYVCQDCCGCQDLYVCVDGGWDLWGECNDAGTVEAADAD